MGRDKELSRLSCIFSRWSIKRCWGQESDDVRILGPSLLAQTARLLTPRPPPPRSPEDPTTPFPPPRLREFIHDVVFQPPRLWRSSPDNLVLTGPVGRHVRVNGRNLLNFSGTDYLGLARNPLARLSAAVAAAEYGNSMSASRATTGTHRLHLQLERALALSMGTEDACLCANGAAACQILLAAIGQPHDVFICEENAHQALMAAIPGSARAETFSQNDLETLENILLWCSQGVILLNGVNPVTGEIAPLAEILSRVADKPGIRVVVDDCHGVFVLGKNGRGTLELARTTSRQVYLAATMSKALGSTGGFVAGSSALCERMRGTAAYRSASALPPTVVAASLANLFTLSRRGPSLRERLHGIDTYAFIRFSMAWFTTRHFGAPILALVPPGERDPKDLARWLCSRGFLLPAVNYPDAHAPAVLRFAARADHREQDINLLVDKI